MVNFLDSGGTFTGNILPTGNPVDTIKLDDGREFSVTIIDAANILVFVKAEDVGATGTELSSAVNGNKALLDTLEKIRVKAGVMIGIITDESQVTPTTHALPKIAMIAPPQEYENENGKTVEKADTDIICRYISMGTLHRALAVSGAIALGAASNIDGTLPNQVVAMKKPQLRIGHPSGTLYVEVQVDKKESEWKANRAAIGRTARRLMEGYTLVPTSVLS